MSAHPVINMYCPTDEELQQYVRYMREIVHECDLHAAPAQERSPWQVIGQLRTCTVELVRMIGNRIREAQIDRERAQKHRDDDAYEYARRGPVVVRT